MSEDASNRIPSAQLAGIMPHRFKPGQSGNPAGRPKGMASAAILIQKEAARIAESPHPHAKAISEKLGFEVTSRLQVLLLQLAQEDPRTFLAYLGGKPVESIDLFTDMLPPVVNVKFGNCDPDAGS